MNKFSKRLAGAFGGGLMASIAVVGQAFAVTPYDTTNTAITTGLTELQSAALAGIAGVLGIALVLMGTPYVIRYLKSIFKTVAR